MPAPTPPDPAVVGVNTLLEGDLPDSVANYDSLAAFAARTETDIEDELIGAENTRWGGGILGGLFAGLQQGKPFIAALIQAIIHKAFPGTTTEYTTHTGALNALETKFLDKWNNLDDTNTAAFGLQTAAGDVFQGTTTDGTLADAVAGMQIMYNSVQENSRAVADINSANTAASTSGSSFVVDFGKYPERFFGGTPSGTFPNYPTDSTADFTLNYSGTGTGSIKIQLGQAHWDPGTGTRTLLAKYRSETQTDYQVFTGTLANPMKPNGARNGIIARCNSANDTYVYAFGYASSLLNYRAELGCYVSGTKHVFATDIPATASFNIGLVCGDSGGVKHFKVFSGTKVIIDYYDTGNVSELCSAGHTTSAAHTSGCTKYRGWGFLVQANGTNVPGDATQVTCADGPS